MLSVSITYPQKSAHIITRLYTFFRNWGHPYCYLFLSRFLDDFCQEAGWNNTKVSWPGRICKPEVHRFLGLFLLLQRFGQKYLTNFLCTLNLLWVCMGIFLRTGLWEGCLGIISLLQIGLAGGIKQEAFHLVVKMYIAVLFNFKAELLEPESFSSHPHLP